jgi:hypothetical protein
MFSQIVLQISKKKWSLRTILKIFLGHLHAFPVILPNIGLYTYFITYIPDIKNILFFFKISKKNSKKKSLISEDIKIRFYSRISFNIGL